MAKTKGTTTKAVCKSSIAKSSQEVKIKHDTAPGRFVPAKTGRVVKLSPAASQLDSERIKAAVHLVVKKRTSS